MWRWDCMKASWKHDESSMKSLWYLYERAMKEPWNDHEVTKNYLKKARKRLLKWAGPAHESLSGPWVPLSGPSATQSAPHLPSHALQKSGKTFGIFCWEQPMACLGARTATSTAYFRGGCILPDLQLTSKPNPNHNPPRKQILARLVSRAVLPPVWPKSLQTFLPHCALHFSLPLWKPVTEYTPILSSTTWKKRCSSASQKKKKKRGDRKLVLIEVSG